MKNEYIRSGDTARGALESYTLELGKGPGGRVYSLDLLILALDPNAKHWGTLEPVGPGCYTVSICGTLAGMSGQVQDDLVAWVASRKKVNISLPLAREIVNLWRRCHLSHMKAGTLLQCHSLTSEYGREYIKGRGDHYEACCKWLAGVGLLTDTITDSAKPYKYGHGWLACPVVSEDLDRLREIFSA